jgi:hypothetical protein
VDKTQTNQDLNRVPLSRVLLVHNLALSRVCGYPAYVTAVPEHSLLEAVWRHCSVYQDLRQAQDIQKIFQIPALLVALFRVHLAAHQKRNGSFSCEVSTFTQQPI